MDAKKMFSDLKKIPIIGDFILSFAIVVVLITLSSAGNFCGYEGEDKKLIINIFISIGFTYFIYSISSRIYFFFKKR